MREKSDTYPTMTLFVIFFAQLHVTIRTSRSTRKSFHTRFRRWQNRVSVLKKFMPHNIVLFVRKMVSLVLNHDKTAKIFKKGKSNFRITAFRVYQIFIFEGRAWYYYVIGWRNSTTRNAFCFTKSRRSGWTFTRRLSHAEKRPLFWTSEVKYLILNICEYIGLDLFWIYKIQEKTHRRISWHSARNFWIALVFWWVRSKEDGTRM